MKIKYTIGLVLLSLSSFAQVEQISIDSINTKLDSLISPPAKLDSVKVITDSRLDSLQKLNQSISKSLDISDPDFSKYKGKLDSLKARLMHRRDSLKGRGLTIEEYTRSLDSPERIDPLKSWKKQQSKVNSAQSKVQNTMEKPFNEVNGKLSQLSSESGGQGNIPGSVGGAPGLPIQNANVDLPELKTDGVTDPLQGTVPGLDPKLNLNTDALNKNLNIDQLSKAKEGLGNVSEITGKAQGYSSDIENIGSGNLEKVKEIPGDIQSKIPMDGTEQLQQGEQSIAEMTKQVNSFKNPEEYRKQTLERGKQEVLKQLTANSPALESTVNKVSQYQKRGSTIFNKAKGLPKKKTKPENIPLIERFVPGITFQVQKKELLMIDFNPSIRYRFNTIFSLGAGWMDRFNFEKASYTDRGRTYGIRIFGEAALIKGFTLRIDAERMNSYVPVSIFLQDQGGRIWRNYYLGGLKKEFTFFPGVLGNIQFMYNFTHKDGTSPYLNRFNVRFGFEFPLKNEN